MSQTRILVHTSLHEIRWGDMDALGHVNNTVFFRYMEQARSDWLHCQLRGHDEGQGTVLVKASCEYLRPLAFPGHVEVRIYAGSPGRSSLETYYELWMTGQKYADGAAKLVWVDIATGRSSPIPERVAAPLRLAVRTSTTGVESGAKTI